MLNPEQAVTTQKRDCQVMHNSPPQPRAWIGAVARNGQQKVRRIQPIRQSVHPTRGSGLCTKGDEERKVTTTMKRTGAREERPMGLRFPSGRREGCGRLDGLWSRLTKPIKAVNKLNVQLSPCVGICQNFRSRGSCRNQQQIGLEQVKENHSLHS